MNKIVVASNNPIKQRAIEGAFARLFPGAPYAVQAVSVPSGVAVQPLTDAETLAGARNRARGARELVPDADYWAGVEGGVEDTADGLLALAWIVVEGRDGEGIGRSGSFLLPPAVAELVRGGMELGHADDIVFGRSNSKQAEGAVGLLTGGVIDRAGLYEHAAVLAFIPFHNAALYNPLYTAPNAME